MKQLLGAVLVSTALFGQGALVEGNPKSPVRVVAYEDLQCSDCALFRVMMDQSLLPRFKGSVAFEHRDFPLAKHKWARKAAIASRYFQSLKPDLAVEFRRHVMGNQETITADTFDEALATFAKTHNIDPAKVKSALDDAALGKLVEDDFQDGIARGVARTPTVFVNSDAFIETFSVEDISKAIAKALQETRK